MLDFLHIDATLSAWSIFIQLMINIPLFLLFLLSWLVTRRKIFLTWTIGWALNLIALGMVLIISNFFINTSTFSQMFFYAMYGSSKILFGILLFFSSIQFSQRRQILSVPFVFFLSVWVFNVFFLLFFSPVLIQFFVYIIIAFLFLLSTYQCSRTFLNECRVIAIGFFIHGTVFFHHFSVILFSWVFNTSIPVYMSRISFFDSISEFILALSFFLAVIIRVVNELKEINSKLEKNQEKLRALVEADPLTGLKNRRVLRKFFESVKDKKGCIAFVDINRFKKINDSLGHEMGDRCLIALAEAMRKVFRAEDGLFRIGGDEFLIVCPGISDYEMGKRLEDLKNLIKNSVKGVSLSIAIGMEQFEPSCRMEDILKSADKKMYRNKR